MQIHAKTYEELAPFDSLTYDISLMSMAMDDMSTFAVDGMNYFACSSTRASNCRLIMSRAFTPVIYYVEPRVVYYGSDIGFQINPRGAQDANNRGNEVPFLEARINGFTVDFEGFIDESTILPAYSES